MPKGFGQNPALAQAGLPTSCAKWLHARDVAILGGDGAQDVLPSGVPARVSQPIHALCIVAMGMPIFDNCDLETVGREAERRRRWEFLVTASPAAVPGATGSVLNPVATAGPDPSSALCDRVLQTPREPAKGCGRFLADWKPEMESSLMFPRTLRKRPAPICGKVCSSPRPD